MSYWARAMAQGQLACAVTCFSDERHPHLVDVKQTRERNGHAMRPWAHLLGLLICCLGVVFTSSAQKLGPLPQGATLPVILDKGLDAHHVKRGEPITASL